MKFTTTICAEDDGYVAPCPELDIASQGDSIDEASANLREAAELFIEIADPSEIERRLRMRQACFYASGGGS
jgi:predicted RNase H-like HicB family nuclease